ncbi:hypothetical protein [Sphingobium sp.]|uniref:hypothetical protein n=1 Tax=Sphingobium sp. TaxID=1912891 RepID=UPI002BA02EC2|nr:hypothetical protein [Sphingobium sp.]HUD91226.1 hypothetical protein [Sphingobium sp.]
MKKTMFVGAAHGVFALAKADGLVWTVVSSGNVFVNFGPDPVAGAGWGHLILAGQARDFSVTTVGEKIAVKDA